MPEGEEEEQTIENLFEQIMKENFPKLAKEIDFWEVQEAHRYGWVWLQNTGRSEAMNTEIKDNIQGTNSEGEETNTQGNDLEEKEEINIQPEQNKEMRIQKNEERLRNT